MINNRIHRSKKKIKTKWTKEIRTIRNEQLEEMYLDGNHNTHTHAPDTTKTKQKKNWKTLMMMIMVVFC